MGVKIDKGYCGNDNDPTITPRKKHITAVIKIKQITVRVLSSI
jgi:hypothetical protein